MSMLPTGRPDYDSFRNSDDKKVVETECRTKQSFKDSCDVNKIVQRFQIKDANAHIVEFPPEAYGEFTGVDLLGAHQQVERANEIFAKLPSEVRKEFGHDPFAFAQFASDPANNGRLSELIPAIARPGAYFPNPVQRGGAGAGAATAPRAASAAGERGSGTPPAPVPESPSSGAPAAAPAEPGPASAPPASSST